MNYRVGVIFGGRTTEHEVSVVSGLQVMEFLGGRHKVTPIYINKAGVWLTGEKLTKRTTYKTLANNDPDLMPLVVTPDCGIQTLQNPLPKGLFKKSDKLELDVLFPVMHGTNGEDGTLQGLFELANIPYVGCGVLASAIAMDKIMTKHVLRSQGIPVLDYFPVSRMDWENDEEEIIDQITQRFAFPLIIKPARGGSSIGIEMAADVDALKFGISVSSHYDSRLIVEPCLVDKVEINCSILGNHDPVASVCEQPVSQNRFLSFSEKYLQSEHHRGMEGAKRIIPAPIAESLTAEVQRLALKAFKAIGGAGIARVDLLIDRRTGQVYVNELNTMPGSISYYLWEPSGIKPEELVDRLIELAMETHQDRIRCNYLSDQSLFNQIDLLGIKK